MVSVAIKNRTRDEIETTYGRIVDGGAGLSAHCIQQRATWNNDSRHQNRISTC